MCTGNLGTLDRSMDRRELKENEKVIGPTDDIGPVRSPFTL